MECGQMYGDTAGSQVTDPQDCAYDIPAEVVEDQDLPDRLSISVRDGARL